MYAARRISALVVLLLAAGCSSSKKDTILPSQAMRLGDLGIEVTTPSRAFVHTNKGDAYLYGEAAGPATSSWQGFNVRGFTFVDDWQWVVDGANLGSSAFSGATVYPDHVVRRYTQGLYESITLLDGQRAMLLEPVSTHTLTLRPLMADSGSTVYYKTQLGTHALCIVRKNHQSSTGENDHPVWICFQSATGTPAADGAVLNSGGMKPVMTSPGSLALSTEEPVAVTVADTVEEAAAMASDVLLNAAKYKEARAARMQALLDAAYVSTADTDFNQGYSWIRLSMDALTMEQQGKGIFAGIPWFNNYWGRDTFITLGGSHLATGQWEEAAEILTAFSAHQDVDTTSATYGRIPNQVSLSGVIYNTADGTPWFVIQAHAYLVRTADAAFAQTIWPVVERATDAGLATTDENGFLEHGDQETWMDATGSNGPYTPRGNRAVEIEGLWYQQLVAASAIALQAGDTVKAADYSAEADLVASKFVAAYSNPDNGMLYDHLNTDGTPDVQVRPNQLLALRSLGGAAFGPSEASAITHATAAALAYPWGVASLSQLDDAFHPYHIYVGYYPKDEAYHNGVVWGWLSGPLVSLMVQEGQATKAFEQLASLDGIALERGTIGCLPELLDALPRPAPGVTPITLSTNPPDLAGTPYQAWSHGEYLRNVFEDFVGVSYDSPTHAILNPGLPDRWGATVARFRLGTGWVTAELTPGAQGLGVTLTGEGALASDAVVSIGSPGASVQDVRVADHARHLVEVPAPQTGATVWDGFEWVAPYLKPGLASMAGPDWFIIDHATLKLAAAQDVQTILTIADPAGDDTGPAGRSYTYPADPHFAPSIFDLRTFTLREDASAFYFDIDMENLVQPGWNPQDGFQLTYAAILFDTHGADEGTLVHHQALYTLPAGFGIAYAVYVGAGIEVQDATGKTLATYTPSSGDVTDPLGSVDTKSITFRVPKQVIPALPSGTSVIVLTGSQDDFGNGSMGDFRKVDTTAAQWTGGGRQSASDPNVYDFADGTIGP